MIAADCPTLDNRLIALRALRRNGKMTRRDLADHMHVSLSLATKIIAELTERGLVFEKGKSEGSKSGRPMDWLALVPEAAYAVGLHISHTQYNAVLTNLYGEVITHLIDPIMVTDDRKAIIAGIQDLVRRVLRSKGICEEEIAGLGVGLSDIVDPVSQVSYGWPDLPGWSSAWANFSVGKELSAVLKYNHIYVDDIVRSLGLAEGRYGAAANKGDFVYVVVDEGVGMAIMLNGTPYIGQSHIAGEIAHIPVSQSNVLCSCGSTGCLGTILGSEAVLEATQQKLEGSSVRSSLRQLNHELRIVDVIEQAGEGDKVAIEALSESGEALGQALAVVINVLGPQSIVLGGLFSRSNTFVDAAQRSMRRHALVMAARDVNIIRSNLDEFSGARGAATTVLDALFNPGDHDILHFNKTSGLIKAKNTTEIGNH